MDNTISIDIGYSSTKVLYKGKCYKFPTAISYAIDVGIHYGENNVYSFEDETYYVGNEAINGETFNTIDYKFLERYSPLIIFHILKQFDTINLARPINIKTGLAIVDWSHRNDFIKRISNFEVNGEKVNIHISSITPQGGGIYNSFGKQASNIHILDIGYNTINSIHFENGKPIRTKTNSYPGHGVSSVIKPFVNYLENKFSMSFSSAEAINYFINENFIINGVQDKEVIDKIKELKKQMIKRLFQSVLVNEKKVLSTSDYVVIAGGGAYLLNNVGLPGNIVVITEEAEYANVKGY